MSGPVAILCSGQGGQHRGMFDWLGEVPAASGIFAAAARYLDGTDPRDFVRRSPEPALFANRAGQILCCTQALAAWTMLEGRRPSRVVLAGYSVGELAAWGCAGLFDPEQTLRLASERAVLMDRASPPEAGLAAIVGLRRGMLDPLLARHGLHLAIVNGSDSVVVGGEGWGLEACLQEATGLGASVARRLRVSVPSHTPLLTQAAHGFADVLRGESMGVLAEGVRLLGGVDAEPVRDAAGGLDRLAGQIARTIDWAGCVQACVEAGATRFLELGPGSALARMAGNLAARSVEQFRSAEGVADWLGREG